MPAKKILLLSFFSLLLLLTSHTNAQQNLVPNPSFEDTVSCPIGPGEINKSIGWLSFNGTPDYMHGCNGFSMGVPSNWGGYQQPYSGNAYAAILTYTSSFVNGREHIGCQLSSPLNIGTKYFLSFQVSLSMGGAADGNCASNKIGAMFASVPYFGAELVTNFPPIYTDSIIKDTLGWTQVFGSFIADSTYNFVIFGNFFDDINTDTAKFYNTFSDVAYYYIDNICLSTDSIFTKNYIFNNIQKNKLPKHFKIYPNPVKDYITIESEIPNYNLIIYNTIGNVLFLKENITDDTFFIDLKTFKNELLFLHIKSEKHNEIYKLLKQ
ncbi:MAG: hypothetical protein HJHJAOHD_01730 [Flavobacteriales bacterium]|nr:hypothetical protein [Flavobacteriales bacterium]